MLLSISLLLHIDIACILVAVQTLHSIKVTAPAPDMGLLKIFLTADSIVSCCLRRVISPTLTMTD